MEKNSNDIYVITVGRRAQTSNQYHQYAGQRRTLTRLAIGVLDIRFGTRFSVGCHSDGVVLFIFKLEMGTVELLCHV